MTPQNLEKIGTSLFGTGWRNQIASYLNVNPARVTDWVNGRRPIPAGIWAELDQLAAQRAEQVATVAPKRASKMKALSLPVLAAIKGLATNCESGLEPGMDTGTDYSSMCDYISFRAKTSMDCSAVVHVYQRDKHIEILVRLAGDTHSTDAEIFAGVIGNYDTEAGFLDAYQRWLKTSGNDEVFDRDE